MSEPAGVETPPETTPPAPPGLPPADQMPYAPPGQEPGLLVVRPPGTGPVARVRIEPPAGGMTWAGLVITNDPTEVPAGMVAGLLEAAQNAGVTLTQLFQEA